MSQIITHTLHFNRRSDTQSAAERVSQILESALALYDGWLRQCDIAVQRDYVEADRLLCYPSELRQVFANLIGNAIDAMQAKGTLSLRTRSQPNARTGEPGLRISIADSGHGMDPDTLRRLFQPFVSTKGEQGTGLGLWVSREILDKHHAVINVRSLQTPGSSGTVFSIWIPNAPAVDSGNPPVSP